MPRQKRNLKLSSPLPQTTVTEQEKRQVVAAMLAADASLANVGYGGQGHWNRCTRCGYVYVITDCGGAVEATRCPGCNGTIGGAHHRLAEGNEAAIEYFRLVQDLM